MSVIELALSNLIPEQRSIAGVLNTSSGIGSFLGIYGANKGKQIVNQDTALTLSAFYNGIEILTNDIAIPSKSVYKKQNNKREAQPSHPVNYLIAKRPNQYMTSFMFHKMMAQYAILKGNGYAKKEYHPKTGRVIALQLITEDVEVIKFNNKLFYRFKEGDKINTYAATDIIHIPGFSFDGIVGVSVIRYAAESLGVSLAAQDYSADYYDGKGLGSGYVKSDKELNDIAKNKIGSAFSDILSNGNKWSVPVLDEGMSFHPIQITAAEAQFLLTSKHGIEEVARWLNIPPHKLKSLDKATFSNIENQEIQHNQDSVLPWITKFEQEYDAKLFTTAESNLFVKFNINVLLRADIKSQAEYFSKMIFNGVITRNEVRALIDRNPLDGLDEPLTPVNAQMMDQINAKLQLMQKQLKDVKA